MYQQQTPQPRDEREWNNVSSVGEYDAGYPGTSQQNDQLADAIARRLQMQTAIPVQVPMMNPPKSVQDPANARAGMRLALAIVSVALLLPLTGTILALLTPVSVFGSVLALMAMCSTILGINIAFNVNMH